MQRLITLSKNIRSNPTDKIRERLASFSLSRLLVYGAAAFLLFMTFWCTMVMTGYVLIDQQKLAAYRHPNTMPVQGMSIPVNRDYVHLSEMPEYVRSAFVAVEDHRFYHHFGIDPIAIARSAWVDLTEGRKSQGGSTITMQLARNMFLTNDKTFDRKWKEIAIATYLELKFSKDEILEMYLNNIYYGHGKYGIEEAANFYFNKTTRYGSSAAECVNLSEAAILASLPKAPEFYSPVNHWDKAKSRQQLVLRRMNDLGLITEVQRQMAAEQPVIVQSAS
ncbi:transglycosylase domain-containing protein [Paenibacillus sp. J2TS4]|uniref:transglycosylase domain-containing protein n=1 Tax=Paenibacillus sp. J2TS4 TaxID=2807194 RepID=UPI001B135EAD|nr:biosynthetic peptidoglycan transglycosylase [Paenibacillus sp. J2TS4]GIP34397.1 hypothetical protein J2TS4_36070 [Paenibacillus sp. J2TS4]